MHNTALLQHTGVLVLYQGEQDRTREYCICCTLQYESSRVARTIDGMHVL